MTSNTCGLCGRTPVAGQAQINNVRYCHGDDDAAPTCYELASIGATPLPDLTHVEGARVTALCGECNVSMRGFVLSETGHQGHLLEALRRGWDVLHDGHQLQLVVASIVIPGP